MGHDVIAILVSMYLLTYSEKWSASNVKSGVCQYMYPYFSGIYTPYQKAQVWQPNRPPSLSLRSLTLWPNCLKRCLTTLKCAINPGSKPTGVVGAGMLHKYTFYRHICAGDMILWKRCQSGLCLQARQCHYQWNHYNENITPWYLGYM